MKLSEVITHSYMNRSEIESSQLCGCFYCLNLFEPTKVTVWSDSDDLKDDDPGGMRTDEEAFKGFTAICPYCENDSVIGDAMGVTITKELLNELNAYWHKSK